MGLFDLLRKKRKAKCGAVIVAAGCASRMNGIDKAVAPLCGHPVLLLTCTMFAKSESIDEIVVVTREDLVDTVKMWHLPKVTAVVTGGEDRASSVMKGLEALSKSMDLVAIHDGARPLVTLDLIEKTVKKAGETGAAAPAIPVKDTIKLVDNQVITSTPNRDRLRAIQTPQVFDKELIVGALFKAISTGIPLTDDCSAVEEIGMKVHLVEGDEENIKITTPMDLKIASLIIEGRHNI